MAENTLKLDIEKLKEEIEKAKAEKDYWKYKSLSKTLRIKLRNFS